MREKEPPPRVAELGFRLVIQGWGLAGVGVIVGVWVIVGVGVTVGVLLGVGV